MSSTTDKIKGTANEVAGKAKQGVGEAIDNQSLRNEGDTQEIKGKGQKAVGDVKDGVKKAGNL
nr:CsbD family protein [Pseudomonas luteola]